MSGNAIKRATGIACHRRHCKPGPRRRLFRSLV